MKKITFGKIQINLKKSEGSASAEKPVEEKPQPSASEESTSGFGTFSKDSQNKYNDAIEEIADDLESQHVQEVMGISGFGRKAKTFDITVSFSRKVHERYAVIE